MKHFFDINSIFFELLGYRMSYLEFYAVASGLIAVILSARANIWSWPIGVVNVILSAFFYYQIQLYPDMFLQVFFFVTNIIGWWRWANPKPGEQDMRKELKISKMSRKHFAFTFLVGITGTLIVGIMASRLHEWFPIVFSLPSSYPYADSFILVMSVIATFLMIQKKIECWVIWIVIDIAATNLYWLKAANFFSVEYFIFTILATFGLWNWVLQYKKYRPAVN